MKVDLLIPLLCSLPLSSAFLGNDVFSTADGRLYEVFCNVQSADDLASVGSTTWTHDSLIRAGLGRTLIDFFSEEPEPFVPPADGATLVEIFQAYYGSCASTDRFLLAVQAVVDAAAAGDTQPGIKEDPTEHFDAEEFEDSMKTLSGRFSEFMVALSGASPAYDSGRSLLGQSLHLIQKFYANTNWIESGMNSVCPGLGTVEGQLCISGDVLAQPEQRTCDQSCTSSDTDSDPDACQENLVLPGGILTSGYFHFHNRPANKCGFGGTLDQGEDGGINKATSDFCYSPHAGLHEAAAQLAIQATYEYLNDVRAAIGPGKFKLLFDLSQGSALAILIDTSSSMGDEINAVKQEVAAIVEAAAEGGITPSKYVLAAYETEVDLTETEDPDVFLDAVNALFPSGGTENFYHAARDALEVTPDYSDLIAFTDEPSDDEPELKATVIALAQQKHSKITIIYTASFKEANTRSIEGYQEVCESTGGLFVEFSKVDIDDIIGILSSSIESSRANLLIRDASGIADLEFSVDNFMDHLESTVGIRLTGQLIAGAEIWRNGEVKADLFDSSTYGPLAVEANTVSSTLVDVNFKPDIPGTWSLHAVSSTDYTVSVTASCASSFLGDFRNLDMDTVRPNLRKVDGRPVAGSTPVVYIQLSSELKNEVSSVDALSYVSSSGEVIYTFPTGTQQVQDAYLINTAAFEMPNEEFYLRLEGSDSDSNRFTRYQTTLISPATTSVEVTASSSLIEIPPGSTAEAEFIVTNFGDPTTIDISVTDSLGFLQSVNPASTFLDTNQTAIVVVTFTVPNDYALVGSVSTVVVEVASRFDLTSNFVVTEVAVIADGVDETPPRCVTLFLQGCPVQANSAATCQDGYWDFVGRAWDLESGLLDVSYFDDGNGPSELVVSTDLVPGTTDPVFYALNASCCIRSATITVLDLLGNQARCSEELLPLGDCGRVLVYNVDTNSATVQWTSPCTDWAYLDRYDFTITDANSGVIDLAQNFDCDIGNECSENVEGLRSCIHYVTDLTAYELGGDGGTFSYAPVEFDTWEAPPSEILNVVVEEVGNNEIALSWLPPLDNRECVALYQVCYSNEDDPNYTTNCVNTPPVSNFDATVTFSITGLQACSLYYVTVQPVTPSGEVGRIFALNQLTGSAAPGPAENVIVEPFSGECLKLSWDPPTTNPLCVDAYILSCGESSTRTSDHPFKTVFAESDEAFEDYYCSLEPCSEYVCSVAVAYGGQIVLGDYVNSTTPLDEPPSEPRFFAVSGTEETSATLTWSRPENGFKCLSGYLISYESQNSIDSEGSVVVSQDQISELIGGLLPCTQYDFHIQGIVGPSEYGLQASQSDATRSTVPGQPMFLQATEATCNSIRLTWESPNENPQCVDRYDLNLLQLNKKTGSSSKTNLRQSDDIYDITQSGLDSGSDYEADVFFISVENQRGESSSVQFRTLPDCEDPPSATSIITTYTTTSTTPDVTTSTTPDVTTSTTTDYPTTTSAANSPHASHHFFRHP